MERIDTVPKTNLKIIQDKEKFSYGIDAVLLADFAYIRKKDKVVDLGTGNGIIPLILAGAYGPQKIYGVEIQEEVAKMARRSVSLNKLEDKIEILNIDLKNLEEDLEEDSVDKILSNPPYMKIGQGFTNPNQALSIARHEVHCTIEDIMEKANYLLKQNGRLYLIHRPNRLVDIFCLGRKHKMEAKRIRLIHPKEGREANLVLVELSKLGKEELRVEKPLYVYGEDGNYTEEILEIYRKES